MASCFRLSPKKQGDLEQLKPEPPAEPAEPAEPPRKFKPMLTGAWCHQHVEMSEEVRKAWKEQVMERVEMIKDETVRKEASAQVEARECHVLERFKALLPIRIYHNGALRPPPPVGDGIFDVVFKNQGDKLPAELQKHMQEYRDFLEKTEETWKTNITTLEAGRKFAMQPQVLRCGGQGTNLIGADFCQLCLPGVDFHSAQLQGVVLTRANLQGAVMSQAKLQGADLACSWLQGAVLAYVQLQGANLLCACLQGADLHDADLTSAVLTDCNLTDANLAGVTWEKGNPPTGPVRCDPLDEPKFPKRKGGIRFAQSLMHFLKKLNPWADDEDEEEDEGDESDEEEDEVQDETGGEEPAEVGAEGDRSNECCIPLLDCGSNVAKDIQKEVQEEVEMALDMTAEAADAQLDQAARKATERLELLMKELDAAAKPQVKMLKTIVARMQSDAIRKLGPEKQQKLIHAVNLLSRLPTVKKGLNKFNQQLDEFKATVEKVEGSGLSRLLTKLTNSQLQRATGYSSGDFLAFLKCSPKQMAQDTRELEDITNYLEKLQETVNVNNWDDIVDNFMCLYELNTQLKGERSCAIFLSIWKDKDLRRSIATADKFQKVKNVNDPPIFIIHEVKSAVGHVKKNATAWKIAMKKELAAIDLIKQRQQAFFQFLISCISGVFVFLATLFSGLIVDSMEAGKVNVPFLSDLLNSTANF